MQIAFRSLALRFLPSMAALLVASLAAGCGPIYFPALFDSNYPPAVPLRMEKPATYVGADAHYSNGYNSNESNMLARAQVAWGTGEKWWRTSISGGLYGGSYHVTASLDSTERGHRGYLGMVGMFDANLAIPGDKATIGLGMNAGLMYEGGPYASIWLNSRLPIIPLLGAYAFFGFRLGDANWAEFQLHMGVPGMLSTNVQFDMGDYLLWGGAGATIASDNESGFGRFAVGTSVKLK